MFRITEGALVLKEGRAQSEGLTAVQIPTADP